MANKNFADMLNKPVRTNVNATETKAAAEPKKAAASKTTVAPARAAEPVRAKGRPVKDEAKGKKKDYCKTINIAVPKEIIEEVNKTALQVRGMSLTDYVNFLITRDLERNRKNYERELTKSPALDD